MDKDSLESLPLLSDKRPGSDTDDRNNDDNEPANSSFSHESPSIAQKRNRDLMNSLFPDPANGVSERKHTEVPQSHSNIVVEKYNGQTQSGTEFIRNNFLRCVVSLVLILIVLVFNSASFTLLSHLFGSAQSAIGAGVILIICIIAIFYFVLFPGR